MLRIYAWLLLERTLGNAKFKQTITYIEKVIQWRLKDNHSIIP